MDVLFGKLNNFGPKEIQDNQFFSLIILVAIVFVLSLLIYFAVKKQKADKAPNNGVLLVESLVTLSNDYADNLSENRLRKANPYFISLFIFLFFGHLISLLGFAPVGNSVSVIFAATAVTWISMVLLGFYHSKIKYLIKLLNPIEMAGNFSPLISLTFRLFGNITGGIVLFVLLNSTLDGLWKSIIKSSSEMAIAMNPIKMLITPILNLYLDIFVGAIQAFVFITLTISYWSQASEEEVKEKIKSKVKQAKEKLLQNENKELNGEPQVNLIQ